MLRSYLRVALLCLGLFPSLAAAASVQLAWDASAGPNVSGYRLYYGTDSGVYADTVDVGLALTGTVANLTPGQAYFFAVKARNAAGESPFSNEVAYTIPEAPPGAPGLLRVQVTVDVQMPTEQR